MVEARLRAVSCFSLQFKLLHAKPKHASDKAASRVTWDQALFSFRFVNNSPAGMAKRKESPIQTFYETSAAHFFWLTFAETSNQNYFRCLFFQDANFSRVGKMQTGWLKNSFNLLIFSAKNKTVSTITFNFLRD